MDVGPESSPSKRTRWSLPLSVYARLEGSAVRHAALRSERYMVILGRPTGWNGEDYKTVNDCKRSRRSRHPPLGKALHSVSSL